MFEGKGIRTVIIVAVAIFAGVIAFLYLQNKKVANERIEAQEKVAEITKELDKAMEEMLELEVLSEDREEQIQVRETMLKEKIAEVTNLKERIKELKRQGFVDQKVIETLEEKVDQLEQELLQFSSEEVQFLTAQVQDRENIIDSIRKSTVVLRSENETLRRQLEAANIVPDVPEPPNNAAGVPKAVSFKYFNVTSGGRQAIVNPKASELVELMVCFDLLGGLALNVPVDNYDIYMEYKHPDGSLATTASSGSRAMGDDGSENRLYTTNTTVRLEGDSKDVCMSIKLDGESFQKGRQRVVIYCRGKEIGSDYFEIQ